MVKSRVEPRTIIFVSKLCKLNSCYSLPTMKLSGVGMSKIRCPQLISSIPTKKVNKHKRENQILGAFLKSFFIRITA